MGALHYKAPPLDLCVEGKAKAWALAATLTLVLALGNGEMHAHGKKKKKIARKQNTVASLETACKTPPPSLSLSFSLNYTCNHVAADKLNYQLEEFWGCCLVFFPRREYLIL